jgi:hypothetical protein
MMIKIRMIARARPLPKRSAACRVDAAKGILTLRPIKMKKAAESPSFRINRLPERPEARRYSIDLSGFVIYPTRQLIAERRRCASTARRGNVTLARTARERCRRRPVSV